MNKPQKQAINVSKTSNKAKETKTVQAPSTYSNMLCCGCGSTTHELTIDNKEFMYKFRTNWMGDKTPFIFKINGKCTKTNYVYELKPEKVYIKCSGVEFNSEGVELNSEGGIQDLTFVKLCKTITNNEHEDALVMAMSSDISVKFDSILLIPLDLLGDYSGFHSCIRSRLQKLDNSEEEKGKIAKKIQDTLSFISHVKLCESK